MRTPVNKISAIFIIGMLPVVSFSQDVFTLMDGFLKKAQDAPQWSWIQVSRTFEKQKPDALTTETCYFSKKNNGNYMTCKGDGIEIETLSEGNLFLQVDKASQTIALAKMNSDSIWLNTQNSFLKFKEITDKVSERKGNPANAGEKVFTIHPKKEFLTMYDSIVYRWEAERLKKMEIYPAKQYQSLIASNDDYSENPAPNRPDYLDIHWEIVYESLEALPFATPVIDNYVIKKPDGSYDLTEKYKSFSLYSSF